VEELVPGWSIAARIWWSLTWRVLLYTLLASGFAGFVIGIVLAATGVAVDEIPGWAQYLGIVVAIPVGIGVVKKVLGLTWGRVRIAVVPSYERLVEQEIGNGEH
jgi:hypothetical protein